MLDSIRVSTPMFYTDKITIENGWQQRTDSFLQFWKNVKLDNKANIHIEFYPYTSTLVLHFSASKIQNGTNAIAYDFARSGAVENTITRIVEEELGVKTKTKDMLICRLDLNRDFVYEDEESVNAVLEFANKILPARCERRKDYENGFTSQTKKGNGLRVYPKHKDEHLSKKERNKMDPTVRFEFQMNKKAVTRTFGYRPNLHQILTNKVSVELAWNKLLKVYCLDKEIVTRKELHDFTIKNITQLSIKIALQQMNDEPDFSDKEFRKKQLAVTRKFKSFGICPYSCEAPIMMKIKVCDTIMKMRKEKRIWNYTANIRPYKSRTIVRDTPRNSKWYLDSS